MHKKKYYDRKGHERNKEQGFKDTHNRSCPKYIKSLDDTKIGRKKDEVNLKKVKYISRKEEVLSSDLKHIRKLINNLWKKI